MTLTQFFSREWPRIAHEFSLSKIHDTLMIIFLLFTAALPVMAQDDIVPQADGYEWPKGKEVKARLSQWQDLKFGGHRGVVEHLRRELDTPRHHHDLSTIHRLVQLLGRPILSARLRPEAVGASML